MSGRLEQVYLPSDSRLDLPRDPDGPLFKLDFKKGGRGTIPVTAWAIIYIRPGPLVRYGTGVNHYQMWLNIVIKFVKKPARRLKVSYTNIFNPIVDRGANLPPNWFFNITQKLLGLGS